METWPAKRHSAQRHRFFAWGDLLYFMFAGIYFLTETEGVSADEGEEDEVVKNGSHLRINAGC